MTNYVDIEGKLTTASTLPIQNAHFNGIIVQAGVINI